jgi:HAD superfamily phosphoserine phosphatase-like hydrolase
MKFLFDLDGTLTRQETLPLIAAHFGITAQIETLTRHTVNGDIPFMESFIKRVEILRKLPVSTICSLLEKVPVFENLLAFIQQHRESCAIVTGNLDVWVEAIAKKVGCPVYASQAACENDQVRSILTILRKESVVSRYKSAGETVVFIGDGNNDAEAMRLADISIASGLVHSPAKSLLTFSDYLVYEESALCRLLHQICSNPQGKSLVISCAGVGSRLGLGQTKSLIKIHGQSILHHQLDAFQEVEDVRIVVGFQAQELIQEALQKRRDVVFAFNHDYFNTRTAASLYLGARHAYSHIIAWDGDLLVHPEDVPRCLEADHEYAGCSALSTDDSVFVRLNSNDEVTSFSRESGDLEWSGPALLLKHRLHFTSGHVYNQIESFLPIKALKIRAKDIDTYEDYQSALRLLDEWQPGNRRIHEYYDHLSKTITDPLQTRNKAPDFSAFDIQFVRGFASPHKTLLDLGSGTGLLLNALPEHFHQVVAVEKYPEFARFIQPAPNLHLVIDDLLHFQSSQTFDVITLFGVMNYFNRQEALSIYAKVHRWLKPGGTLLIKHNMGTESDVTVDGFSEELQRRYFSNYRSLQHETELLTSLGFSIQNTVDIYPSEFNRWNNTHYYALVCTR